MVITMSTMSILNCTTFKSRLFGLMFQKNIKTALCFPHCNSIHTFFMRIPIFVIVTNKEHIVLYCSIVKPWKIVKPIKNGYYTYEFPLSNMPKISINELFKGNH